MARALIQRQSFHQLNAMPWQSRLKTQARVISLPATGYAQNEKVRIKQPAEKVQQSFFRNDNCQVIGTATVLNIKSL